MKISNKIRIILLLLTVVSVYSCKDSFLDTPPQAALSNTTLASSKSGVNATLIATYKSLQGWTGNWGAGPWGTSPSNWIFNGAGDDYHKGSEPGDGDNFLAYQLFQWNPADDALNHKWIASYEGISRANSSIRTARDFAKANAAEADFAKEIEGEATFLRSYFHFDLYKIFKNAPYYYETDTNFEKPNSEPMLPLIIKDLEKSITMLPENKGAVGRVDKSIATAFLGKAKLYGKDYAGALAEFNKVINSKKYSLADCIYDNFNMATENNSEMIFSVQSSVNDGDGDGSNANFADRLGLPHGDSFTGCCGFRQPTNDLVMSYKVDANGLPIPTLGVPVKRIKAGDDDVLDPRVDYMAGRTGVPYLDWGVHKDSWIRGSGYQGWYSNKKTVHTKSIPTLSGGWAGTQLSGLNLSLMRYSDLLLMAAECEVEVGDINKAREYVNMIRKRAGNCAQGETSLKVPIDSPEIKWAKYDVKPYSAAWTNKDAARAAVRLERRLELALEGHRFFDLRRWEVLETVMPEFIARESKLVTVLGQAQPVGKRHYAYPLPTQEIARSAGNLKQNEGF